MLAVMLRRARSRTGSKSRWKLAFPFKCFKLHSRRLQISFRLSETRRVLDDLASEGLGCISASCRGTQLRKTKYDKKIQLSSGILFSGERRPSPQRDFPGARSSAAIQPPFDAAPSFFLSGREAPTEACVGKVCGVLDECGQTRRDDPHWPMAVA